MLTIYIPKTEVYNEVINEFHTLPAYSVDLEHSLFSISKWEAIYKKPYLDDAKKTDKETLAYIQCMALTSNIPDEAYSRIPNSEITKISNYITDSMTATWFSKDNESKNPFAKPIITSEVIYYWLVSMQIPFECQHWHLNRLLTLVRVIHEKNKPQKKMSKRDLASRNHALNEARRAQLNTTG